MIAFLLVSSTSLSTSPICLFGFTGGSGILGMNALINQSIFNTSLIFDLPAMEEGISRVSHCPEYREE